VLFFPQEENRWDSPMPEAVAEKISAEAATLTKATLRAAQELDIKNQVLATILGLSESTVSRMTKNKYFVERGRKDFELAALFVRLYRSLDAIVGGDQKVARSWLNNKNVVWRDAPINMIQTVTGLVDVINYLDTRRARI
jgi:hypothetical protein